MPEPEKRTICSVHATFVRDQLTHVDGPLKLGRLNPFATEYLYRVELCHKQTSGYRHTIVCQLFGSEFAYREMTSQWIRDLFVLQPKSEPMEGVPTLFRPYIVYRSRDAGPTGMWPVRRGWDPVTEPPNPKRLNRP